MQPFHELSADRATWQPASSLPEIEPPQLPVAQQRRRNRAVWVAAALAVLTLALAVTAVALVVSKRGQVPPAVPVLPLAPEL